MKNCTVCGSANLNEFRDADHDLRRWWCEDCGSMHSATRTWRPEKSMLHHQVRAFHERFGQAIGDKPHVPDGKTVRFRLNLIAEEFLELLHAGLIGRETCMQLERILKDAIEKLPIRVDLPAFVDALADLAYVMEGTAITLGVNMTPIAAEVQRANMSKIPALTGDRYGGVAADLPRPTKPEGWKPPDIEGELKAQGWGCPHCGDPACREGCRT